MARDVIDLAMMRPDIRLLRSAIAKAEGAYGEAVRRDLSMAIDALTGDPARVAACVAAMRMSDTPPAVLVQRLRELRARLKKA